MIAGGDCNSRPGNLNNISSQINDWHYSENIDINTNSNGINRFPYLCINAEILPLNHLNFGEFSFPGQFTYHKAGKSSQIDFVLVNSQSINDINNFGFLNTDWHISDHIPVTLEIHVSQKSSLENILLRANDLNNKLQPVKFTRFRGAFNYDVINNHLSDMQTNTLDSLYNSI